MSVDGEVATLRGQFTEFARMLDLSHSGDTITLYCSDYWMRQAKIIDDRDVTVTDTGIHWCKFGKAELNWSEWQDYLSKLCVAKGLDKIEVENALTDCGLPGTVSINVPQYRDFFDTYRSKKALMVCESVDSCGNPKKRNNNN